MGAFCLELSMSSFLFTTDFWFLPTSEPFQMGAGAEWEYPVGRFGKPRLT